MAELMQIERRGAFAILRFNRPEKLNAFNGEARRALIAAVDELAADDAVAGLVLTGAGRAFSAGGDMDWFQAMIDDPALFRGIAHDAK